MEKPWMISPYILTLNSPYINPLELTQALAPEYTDSILLLPLLQQLGFCSFLAVAMAEVETDVATGQPKRRTFRKFSLRGLISTSSSICQLMSLSSSSQLALVECSWI